MLVGRAWAGVGGGAGGPSLVGPGAQGALLPAFAAGCGRALAAGHTRRAVAGGGRLCCCRV